MARLFRLPFGISGQLQASIDKSLVVKQEKATYLSRLNMPAKAIGREMHFLRRY
jgi:hypothetical protein